MADTPPAPFASLSSDHYDAVVTDIRFVLRRDADPAWLKRESVEHQEFVMAYAISGRASYRCGEENLSIGPGDLLLFPKGLRRLGRSDPQDPWTFFSVGFELHFADSRVEERLAALPRRVAAGNALELYRLFSELERAWTARAPGYLLRCRGILSQLLGVFVHACARSAQPVSHGRKLIAVVELLQRDYARGYPVAELAAMAELSPSRFRVLFKEFTGHPVTRFQNGLRINRAKDLLLSGEYTVTETAQRVGFGDVYYFSRLFKKLTGVKPSSYRSR